jgi:hypothetical protein
MKQRMNPDLSRPFSLFPRVSSRADLQSKTLQPLSVHFVHHVHCVLRASDRALGEAWMSRTIFKSEYFLPAGSLDYA